ncbi:MAG: ethylbenzene dehydrogenase-related protein, partial [Dehalococcoidia bacterium]
TGVDVTLAQPDYTGTDFDVPNELPDLSATVKVAIDDQNIYVLYEIDDDYDFDPADHSFSAAMGVMFLIDSAAGPHMGADDPDLETGLGMVDIWHWELDCAAGVTSGGGDPGSGNDPNCNLDDEFATDPETREDDGDDPAVNPNGENSLTGVWDHTNSAGGIGADGTWIFEISRPLQTGDSEDAQFAAGGTAQMALAYWDADESLEGWTAEGHVQSADEGWIDVNLPGAAQDTPTPGPTTGATPAAVPTTGGSPDGGSSTTVALILALVGAATVVGVATLYLRMRSKSA